MDINISYFDVGLIKADEIYWHSNFLGITAADDLLKSFENALEKLNVAKMVQVGMDGAKVIWSLIEKLPGLINIGSCNLHIVHGAFKTGVESTNWNVKHTLKGLFHLLHDAQSRRAIYANLRIVQYPQFIVGPGGLKINRWLIG